MVVFLGKSISAQFGEDDAEIRLAGQSLYDDTIRLAGKIGVEPLD